MKKKTSALAIAFAAMVLSCDGRKSEGSSTNSARNGVEATPLAISYEYADTRSRAVGIPTGASAFRSEGKEKTGTALMVAAGAGINEDDNETRPLIKVPMSLRNEAGSEVAKVTAWFAPFADSSNVVRALIDDRYESVYTWGEIPGYSPATIVTTDKKTGEKVQETKDVEFVKDGGGLLRGLEVFYDRGEVVGVVQFVRQIGTGLLVQERIEDGVLARDYHPYEFVMAGWPSGRSTMGFGGM